VDGFGNVQLAATADDLTAAGISPGRRAFVHIGPAARPALVAETFGDVGLGELVVFLDSDGYAAVAVNGGSAAAALDVRDADSVLLLVAPPAAARTLD
jgi:S-adenosylmethionine hydrolase